ncbi:MAG: shikimate dehydrogenase [Betaproteobacteria bacterium]|nr:shikimate dehydrogenase [Betaproteobacteria bacterium]
MDRYAVIGHPVAHSRSPQIHTLFAEATRQDMCYERIGPELDQFEVAVTQFMAEGGKGLNVTLPFKERAFALADVQSARARAAGAANTLTFYKGEIFADNTDGVGLVRDIVQNQHFTLAHRSILLLGAGGAARGVIQLLLAEGPIRLIIANRTAGRALTVLSELRASGVVSEDLLAHCQACGLESISAEHFDVVINATSSSLSGGSTPGVPAEVFGPETLAYDMVYGKGLTPFLALARTHGALLLSDGLGMLVEQAAESFYLWRNVFPHTAPVLQQLRVELLE